MIKRFFAGAAPLYAFAALALAVYWTLFQTSLVDLNALVRSAVQSNYLNAFVFLCVLVESAFPYFAYFPGTILILLALTIGAAEQLGPLAYLLAWMAIVMGGLFSYVQARFFNGLLRRVASASVISGAEASLDRFGRFARLVAYLHPNYSATYFTALGLLARPVWRDAAYLCVGAVASVGILFFLAGKVIGSLQLDENGGLQLVLAAFLFVMGTWAGVRSATSRIARSA